MPVARIITRAPQEAELVAGELRARGYTVEIVGPGTPQRSRADLEINVEICDPEKALESAQELAEIGADVFVAAGTFVIAEPTPALVEQGQQALTPAAPARKVWEPEPEPERGSIVRDLANVAGPAVAAAAGAMRRFTVASASQARQLGSSAIAGARRFTRDAAAAIAVQFARRAEQRRHARQRRALQQTTQRTQTAQRTRVSSPLVRSKPQPQPGRLPVIRRTRSRDYEWRTAGVFSLALAIGITLAWAAANRRPAAPVPTSVILRSSSMQQQVPFGPVTLPAPAKPHGESIKKLKPSTHKPAVAARHQPDESGNEVVVRHFTRARTQPPSRPAVAVRRTVVND